VEHKFRLFLILLSSVILTATTTKALTAPSRPQTQIETDQKAGIIRFIVNNREQARIDATGLHVRDNIEYGGTVTDTGEAAHAK
jgi:hypothetical protein